MKIWLITLIFTVFFLIANTAVDQVLAESQSAYRLMHISTDEKFVYVADSGRNELLVVDLDSATEFKRILVENDPRDIAVTDGKIYVTNFGSASVSIIDENTLQVIDRVDVDFLPWGINPSNNGVYVANWGGKGPSATSEFEKGSISVIEPIRNNCSQNLSGTDSGAGWGVNTSPDGKWVVVTNDGWSIVVIYNVETCETRTFELAPTCNLPWDLEVTDDGEIVISCGIGEPNFFPVYNLSCLLEFEPNGGPEINTGSETWYDPSECLTVNLECPNCTSAVNEPWAAYSANGKIAGADTGTGDMTSKNFNGAIYVWDSNSFALTDTITHDNYPNMGLAPRDVLITPDGDIIISSSGTPVISNKPNLLSGIPFDYSNVAGAKVNILYTDGSMITIPTSMDTDGDGLTDDSEATFIGTKPYVEDTDGDTFSDGTEVTAGTNPTNPDEYPGSVKPLWETFIVIMIVVVAIILAIVFILKNKSSKKNCEEEEELIDLESDVFVKELFEKNIIISYLDPDKMEVYIVKEERDAAKNSLKVTSDSDVNWTVNLVNYSGIYAVKSWHDLDSHILLETKKPVTLQKRKCKDYIAFQTCINRRRHNDSYKFREDVCICKKVLTNTTCVGEKKSVKIAKYGAQFCLGLPDNNATRKFWVCTDPCT